ncbi:hypothetical protein B0H11DRAFT_2189983 [Mycena galericulata]|nr:hypothetical protein B0H11DRAFT_2189983 [Mycena galericulata]
MSSIPTPTPPTPRTPRRRPFSPVASRSPGTPRKRVPPRSTRLQGYGKSLIFEAVAVLGGRKKVTIVICPLKAPEADRLAGILKSNFASLQVKQAGEKGISAIEINEDNANDPTVWRKAEKNGTFRPFREIVDGCKISVSSAGAGGSKWTGKPSARRQGFERELPEALQFIPGEFGLPVVIVILESSQVGSKVCRNTGVVVEERDILKIILESVSKWGRNPSENTCLVFTSLDQASLRESPACRRGDRLAPNLGGRLASAPPPFDFPAAWRKGPEPQITARNKSPPPTEIGRPMSIRGYRYPPWMPRFTPLLSITPPNAHSLTSCGLARLHYLASAGAFVPLALIPLWLCCTCAFVAAPLLSIVPVFPGPSECCVLLGCLYGTIHAAALIVKWLHTLHDKMSSKI